MSTQFLKGRRNHFIGVPKLIVLLLITLVLALAASCSPKDAAQPGDSEPAAEKTADSTSAAAPEEYEIAVFIPGALAGSPTYQMLADGVKKAAREYESATVKIVEGGFNQAEWQDKVTQLAATGTYELIVSSNPALPEISRRVSSSFPNQKFLLFDGYLEGEENIYTFRYNQFEQAFLAGHMAGLVTTSSMEGANSDLKIGLLAGQEYPDMNQAILPGFKKGAQWVEEGIKVDFRVLGNWYDATKAAEMADSMLKSGVDIILTIAGGANQGVLKSSKEHGSYVLWFDTNGYEKAPGTVIGSTALRQEKAAYEKTKQAIEGNLQFGKAEVVGVEEGWITFLKDDPHFTSNVPESIRKKQTEILEKMQNGGISFEMPK
ncbi:MAG: BMP family ABC transporter substrate-binding protein [Spirochaetaceae bacterium]|nr:BMP family ABC transporter substrate-binding protein [Spirochaetaceae bacterium]MCF7948336.1 BMP family ABC transporter substrate-binding protein [Spirochaetia bacterium]MCF7952434.1 BMP family ABC transporter substrate-binding protein [Spirochaetaceae bacterium]